MKKWKVDPSFSDGRGNIADILYKTPIEHVSIISSVAGAIRGNHYHKETTQWMFMTKGSMLYIYDNVEERNKLPWKLPMWNKIKTHEIVETPPNEIHQLYFTEDAEFIVFSMGKRGGTDYESDTFRVTPLLDSPSDYI